MKGTEYIEVVEKMTGTGFVFILEKKRANGEYDWVVHRSAHSTIGGASKIIAKLLTVQEINGRDAPNRWERDQQQLKYRTGIWGYTSYVIHQLEVD
jgi:hypothetical protein